MPVYEDTITSCELFLPMSSTTLAGDMSGNGRDGTLGGTVAFDSANGGSYAFSAGSDRITCGTWAWGSAFTLHVRASWSGTTSGAMTLISKCDAVADDNMIAYLWYSSTADELSLSAASNTATVSWNPTAGVIYDICVVLSGGTATFYVDGVSIGSGAFTPGTDTTASVNVGSANASGLAYWRGNIYHAYVASRALTADQVASLNDSEPPLPSVDVLLQRDFIGYWPMDDVAGTTHTVFDHATGRHVVNTGMTIGADWLEGTGSADLYTSYFFMDDLTSGRPHTIYSEVYHSAWDSTVQPLAAAMDDDATSDRSWALTANSTAASLLYSANGTSQSTLSTSNAPTSAVWNRALTTYNGTTVRVGLNNGSTIAQNSAASTLFAPYINFRIGSYHDGTSRQYLTSGVRQRNVMAWTRGLSEVERLYVLAGNFDPQRMQPKVINVALLIGQSNQIGHQLVTTDAVTGNIPSPRGTYYGLTPGVWINEINQTPTGFRRAFPRDGENMNWLGPQTGAASILGNDWAIINVAVGASGIAPEWNQWITAWGPTDKALFYDNGEAHYAKAIASLTAAGFTPKLRVIDVHFGESDGNYDQDVADDYEDNLTLFIAQLREDYGDVPIHLPRLSIHQKTVPYLDSIRSATEAVAASVDRVYIMDLDKYDIVGGNDRVHFTNQAQWEIGRAKAQAWLGMLSRTELSDAALTEIGDAVRAELAVELARIDAAITTRLAPTVTGRTLGVESDGDIQGMAGTLNTLDALDTAQDSNVTTLVGMLNDVIAETDDIDTTLVALGTAIDDVPTVSEMNARTILSSSYATSSGQSTILADTSTLTGRLTSTRAGYLDNLSAGAVATQTSVNTIDDFLDTEVAAIKAVTDKLDTALEIDGGVYRLTSNSLEQAPTGGSAPTASAIADAVWDEALAGHVIAGSAGDKLADAATSVSSGGPVVQLPVAEEFTYTLTRRGSTSLAVTPPKYIQASEKLLFAIDFAAVLHDGDALSEILTLTDDTSQSITLTPVGVCGTLAKFWVEDAIASTTYHVECKVSTLFGLTLEGDFLLSTAD